MGKQEILQVLLVDGSVVVVFLEEDATTVKLIQSVVDEISIGDSTSSDNYEGWVAILLGPDSQVKYQEVLSELPESYPYSDIIENRLLHRHEKVFERLNTISEQEANIKSSKLTSDIHEFSQHLHQTCFKVVNSNDQITFSLKGLKDFDDGTLKSIYIPPSVSVKEMCDIIIDGLGLANADNETKKMSPTAYQYILSISKTGNDGSNLTEKLSEETNILLTYLEHKNKVFNNELKAFELVFSTQENWYNKVGTLTSRLTQNLSRPLSVFTFMGEGMNKASYSSPASKNRGNITSPTKSIRHLSLSGQDTDFEVDPSKIATWISGDVGKPRRQTILDPVFNPEWSATYPITRKLRQREKLNSMDEGQDTESSDLVDPNKLQEELSDLDQAFIRVLDDLNIKDAVRAKMLEFPPSKKIELIEQNEAVQRLKSPTPLQSSSSNTGSINRPLSVIQATLPSQPEELASSSAKASLESLLSLEKPTPKAQSSLTGYLFGNLFSGPAETHPEGSVEYYLARLNKNLSPHDMFKCLQSLRITLSSASVSWTRNFLEDGTSIQGFEILLEKFVSKNISTSGDTPGSKFNDIDEDVQLECIRCFRILLNTEPGFHEVLKHPSIIQFLTFSINTTNDKIRNIVAEVLAAICVLSSDGHAQVLEALCDFRLKFQEEFRFQYILDSLHAHISSEGISAIAAYEYKTTCLSFINAIVNSPESLDDRMLLREEFRRRGLQVIFQDLRESYPPESLSKQIECYEEEMEADISELKDRVLIETLESDKNHPLLNIAKNMRQVHEESVLRTVINEIIFFLNNLLTSEMNDEVRYETINVSSKFLQHSIMFKDSEDWNQILSSFFEEARELIGLDVREFLELQPSLKYEIKKMDDFEKQCKDLQSELGSTKNDLSNIKSIPMISYILNQGINDNDDFNLVKTPKDNFTTLVQRLVLKEKEISSLHEKIDSLEKNKLSDSPESKTLENTWTAIKEELDTKKQENTELSSAVESRGKEIAYLKRSLEAVCTRFQLAVNEYIPESIDAIPSAMSLDSPDLFSIPEAKKIQAELEQTRKELEDKESLEAELISYKNKVSMLNLQIQEQNEKLLEKEMELQNYNQGKLHLSDFESAALSNNQIVGKPLERKISHTHSKSENSILSASVTKLTPPSSIQLRDSIRGPSMVLEPISTNLKLKPMGTASTSIPPPPPPPPPFSISKPSTGAPPPPPPPPPLSSLTSKHPIGIPAPPPPPPPLPSLTSKHSTGAPPPPPPPPPTSVPKAPIGAPPPPPPPPPPFKSNSVNTGGKSGPPPPPPPPPLKHGITLACQPTPSDQNLRENLFTSPTGLIGDSLTSISDIFKPRVPMKSFFWKKIPVSKVHETFWARPQESEVLSKLNLEDIEVLFQKKVPKKPGSGYTSIGRRIKEKKNITLIEFNRAYNMAITLARMKMPFSAIKLAILEVNDSRLSIDNLRSLESQAPTQEEIKLVKSYTGTLENLGTAEKYILQIMDIPRLSERLNCMIFRRRFENDVEEIRPELNILNKAVHELKSSKRLVSLFEIILTVGNYLNANTPRGDARGFKLEALRQLKDLKANSKGNTLQITSLLHYFAWISEEHWETLLDVRKDFPSIESAARISVSTLVNNIYSLVQGVKQVKTELRAHKKLISLPVNDKFISTMENFANIASKVTASIKDSGDKLENNIEELLTYFGEDSTTTKPEDFFNLIISFLDAFELARSENTKLKEKAIQKATYIPKAPKAPVSGFGRGDFDVAVRELRSGLRRKRTERPRSQLYIGSTPTNASSMDTSPKS